MTSIPLRWRTNLRVNLVLWPEVAPNIAALVNANGEVYDEQLLLSRFPSEPGRKIPSDPRAVRNTFEALALAGLALRSSSTPSVFRLTALGQTAFSFLGVTGGRRFATDRNRHLLADVMIRALSVVIEYRAIWMLMRATAGMLSNEELNRAMKQLRFLDDVERVAELVASARAADDPTSIGPRLYDDGEYENEGTRGDQRKALNPLFLLAGGGGTFLTMEDEFRRIEDWAVPLIDRRLAEVSVQLHADTDAAIAARLSEYAGVQRCVES